LHDARIVRKSPIRKAPALPSARRGLPRKLPIDWLTRPFLARRPKTPHGQLRFPALDVPKPNRNGPRMSSSLRFCAAAFLALHASLHAETVSLFDGKSFAGWDGDTARTWRIEAGEIVGGSLKETVPQNEFLASTGSYTNFVLRLKFKLTGAEGFVNSGVQIRSQRVPNHNEMIGYQADIGEGWWGAIYDESRRNKVMAKPDEAVTKKAVKPGDWNDYEIRAEGQRVVLKINGVTTVDFTEPDAAIVQHGRLGLQVHGGGKAEVRFKDITIETLP
jgi:hypothetical protein